MAFIFVQMLLALLFVAHVCKCTKQDPNRIAAGVVRQIDNLNDLATDVDNLDRMELRTVHSQPDVARSNPKGNEGTRRKRSFTFTYRIDIKDTVNSLRSYVGASDMNYLSYSSSLEDDAANWTRHCNYDAKLYSGIPRTIYLTEAWLSPIDHVSVLETAFNSTDSYYALRSVELRSVGAAYSYCSNASVNGMNYTNIYLAAYVFSTNSYINDSVPQYTLGEACTTCLSGSYWCVQGLCKDDCSVSAHDSNCYCNSYCMNCADTNSTTCTYQCLEGWTGSRCETRDDMNVTEPTCSTTVRVLITRTTRGTTTVAPTTTISTTRVVPTTTNSSKNVAPVIHPLIHQLLLCATMALFLILYR